jgi:ABC-type sugar transport system substrate-binding protein
VSVIRWVLGLCVMLWVAVAGAADKPVSVVFINPGYSNEPFWVDYSRFMHEAAAQLGMQFEVIYGERDVPRMLQVARQLSHSANPPDYLIFTNEQFAGPQILRLFEGRRTRLFALHSTLNPEQRALTGGSRERYSNWIGSLVPNDEEAGYLMGRALIEQAGGRPAQMLAFTGVKQTPSATLRLDGLHRALAEAPNVRLEQALYGEWQQRRAYEQARALLPRYPRLDLIWSANDEMAFGVMQAAQELGRKLHYSALNNSQRVLQAHADGRIDILASGHFLLGGCALVMLYDHAHGADFASRGGKDQIARLLRLISGDQARNLAKHLKRAQADVDFTRFSAVLNPGGSACSVDALLE